MGASSSPRPPADGMSLHSRNTRLDSCVSWYLFFLLMAIISPAPASLPEADFEARRSFGPTRSIPIRTHSPSFLPPSTNSVRLVASEFLHASLSFLSAPPPLGAPGRLRLRGGDDAAAPDSDVLGLSDDDDDDEDGGEEEEEDEESEESTEEEDPEKFPGERRQKTLLQAAFDGDIPTLKQCIDEGADVSWLSYSCAAYAVTRLPHMPQDEHLLAPNALQAASSNGKAAAVRALVQLGADVNAVNHVGYTPLHFVTYSGSLETCKTLVELGGRLDAVSETGDQPVDKAESLDEAALVQWMEAEMRERKLGRVYGNVLFNDTRNLELHEDSRILFEQGPDLLYVPRAARDADGQPLPEYTQARDQVLRERRARKAKGEIPHDYEEIIKRGMSGRPEDRRWVKERMWSLRREAGYREEEEEEDTRGEEDSSSER